MKKISKIMAMIIAFAMIMTTMLCTTTFVQASSAESQFTPNTASNNISDWRIVSDKNFTDDFSFACAENNYADKYTISPVNKEPNNSTQTGYFIIDAIPEGQKADTTINSFEIDVTRNFKETLNTYYISDYLKVYASDEMNGTYTELTLNNQTTTTNFTTDDTTGNGRIWVNTLDYTIPEDTNYKYIKVEHTGLYYTRRICSYTVGFDYNGLFDCSWDIDETITGTNDVWMIAGFQNACGFLYKSDTGDNVIYIRNKSGEKNGNRAFVVGYLPDGYYMTRIKLLMMK